MSTLSPHYSTENRILSAIRGPEHQQLFSQLERVSLPLGEVIYEPESRIEYVYFPETVVFSMLTLMENGDTVEVGPVGTEGMAGLNIFFGSSISSTRLVVHVAGDALRLRADLLRKELGADKSSFKSILERLLLRYTQMLLAMTGQSCACNKLHSLEQQFARWLLMMHDYVGDELLLTQDLMALTLGVRRAGVTGAALALKDAGLISYRRGHIQILDREGVQAMACECYHVIRGEYDRLFADLPAMSA